MFTPEALNTLSALLGQSEAIESANSQIVEPGAIALPENFKVIDLELFKPMRRRARGKMTTSSIQHFGSYVGMHAQPGSVVFVDTDKMAATAVLNLGTREEPGHADDLAVVTPLKTAAHKALLDLLGRSGSYGLSQRDLAEFMEDWEPTITCFDSSDLIIPTKQAIDAVRRITIDSARSVEAESQSLSESRSVLEKVAASSKAAPLPAFINFVCEPYLGFFSRAYRMRLAIRTGGPNEKQLALTLSLHLIRAEQHQQEIGEELARRVTDAMHDNIPTYLGGYAPGR